MTRSKVIVLLLLGMAAVKLSATIGSRAVDWYGVCQTNRDKFSDDPCVPHALLGALSETRPFSWVLKVTPSTRSLELILATDRYDSLVAAGRHGDALPYAMEALWLHVRIFGPEHPGSAVMFENLAALHCSLGDDEEAASLESRAAAIRAK